MTASLQETPARSLVLPPRQPKLTVAMKHSRQIRRRILQTMGNDPWAVPALSHATKLPFDTVRIHLEALRRLGWVTLQRHQKQAENVFKGHMGRPPHIWRRVDTVGGEKQTV